MEPMNRIQAFIVDTSTQQLAAYLTSIIKPGVCRMQFQPGRCTACEPWINYRDGKADLPPACIEPLREYIKTHKDLSAELPITFTVPNLGIAKGGIAWFMRTTNRPAMYDAIRTNLSAFFLPHSCMLGEVSANQWYNKNMEAVAQKILSQLAGKGSDIRHDSRGERHPDNGIGGGGPGRGGAAGVLLPEKEFGFSDDSSAKSEFQM